MMNRNLYFRNDHDSVYDVDTLLCKIAQIEPYSAIVRDLMDHEPQPCKNHFIRLILSNDTHLYVNTTALNNLTEYYDKLNCSYRSYRRIEPMVYEKDCKIAYDSQIHFFNKPIRVKKEFVQVNCFLKNNMIYEDYHTFVRIKMPGYFT